MEIIEKKLNQVEQWITRKITSSKIAIGNHFNKSDIAANQTATGHQSFCFPIDKLHEAFHIERKEIILRNLIMNENSIFFHLLKNNETTTYIDKNSVSNTIEANHINTALLSIKHHQFNADRALQPIKKELGSDLEYYLLNGLPKGTVILCKNSEFQKNKFHRSAISVFITPMKTEQYQAAWGFSDRKIYNDDEIQALIKNQYCVDINYSFSFNLDVGSSFFVINPGNK
jgi:hypothetical protein